MLQYHPIKLREIITCALVVYIRVMATLYVVLRIYCDFIYNIYCDKMPPKFEIWTSEAEQLLIYLVEERTIVWDVTQNNYRRNDLKELRWEEISQKMGTPYTGKQNDYDFEH